MGVRRARRLVGSAVIAGIALSVITGGFLTVASARPAPTKAMAGMESEMRAASEAAASSTPKSGSTITIHNFAFAPGSLKVHPGQKVTVVNKDSVTHTVTSTTGRFNTGDVGPGQTVTFTAPTKAGRYPYRCNIHQYMTGTLVVS